MNNINISIVLYKNNINAIKKVISSCLSLRLIYRIYLIDNSPIDEFRVFSNIDKRIRYIFNNNNLGFGKGHNIAFIESIKDNIIYHLVLNPDVYFENEVLEEIYNFMEGNHDIGLVMPKVLNPDGSLQYLCKLLPTPINVFVRRFLNFGPLKKFIEKMNYVYEMRFTGYDKIMNVPYLSGCFMFLRTEVLKEIGLFDENFFMYFEDIDLSRRIHQKYRTVYYPFVSIYHEYAKGSYKYKKLLKYHIKSAIYYFNKWGWFFDKERNIINEETLKKLRYKK